MSAEAWHGTIGGYTNHGCRCTACRAANSDSQRKWISEPRNRAKHNRRTNARTRALARLSRIYAAEYTALYAEELGKERQPS